MEKIKISAVIITFNEEKNIERCLKSLSWVDEIIVVDSFSTDATLDICSRYPVKIFQKKFGGYASQRNFGVEKANYDWILMVDADEEITQQLNVEIMETVKQNNDIIAFYIPRNNFSFGKHIRYGSNYPDYQLRLFKSTRVRYDKEIHEVAKVDGKIGYLRYPIIHRTYSTISEYLPKLNSFTEIEAKEMIKNNIKVSWLKIVFYPILRFFWTYIIKNGWQDGFAGFLMSVFGSFYMLTKYLKYKELIKKNANRN